LAAIAHAVNAACDAQDGVSDGILNDPRQCRFEPASMLCKSGDSDSCLTTAQATALKKLYQGAHDSRGHAIFPGFLPGAELGSGGWGTWITGAGPGKSLLFAFASNYFSNMVYGKPGWDYKTAKLDQAVKDADKTTSRVLNATNPDLKSFQARGGKLILYHGWNDPAISALNTIAYYDQVIATLGRQTTDSFVRLYMVPGMQHCFGGLGPDSFGESGTTVPHDPEHDIQLALEQWVEQGTAPSTIIATKYAGDEMEPPGKAAVKMMRPLCPYPQSAHYKGSGDPNHPDSFTCESGRK
jgi:feruloyl esterase